MKNPIKAIIIDDGPYAIENLEFVLRNFDFVKIAATFTGADEALNWLHGQYVDIIFLDVEMPGKNGFDFLGELNKYPIEPCIIFITGYEKYAVEAIRAAAFDFLLKPVAKDELEQVLDRYNENLIKESLQEKAGILLRRMDTTKRMVFTYQSGFVAYHIDDILYFKASRNYSEVHLVSGKIQVVSMQLGQIEKAVCPDTFFRINRSVIINLLYFTHSDQKERKCYLEVNGQSFEFDMKVPKMKELMGVMMGE